MKKIKAYKIDKILLYISDILKFFGTAMMFSAMTSIFFISKQGAEHPAATAFYLIFGGICILVGGVIVYVVGED